ncbi:MAG: hypothetical protein JWQ72_2313, partial [Polaromonas sp.]|nr:hypothetical protein [Polaromonas sp.]
NTPRRGVKEDYCLKNETCHAPAAADGSRAGGATGWPGQRLSGVLAELALKRQAGDQRGVR